LAALLGGRGFRMYVCPAKPDLTDQIVNEVGEWHHRHILGDTPPENSVPSEETMRRMVRRDVTVEIEDERAVALADDYVFFRGIRLKGKRDEDTAQAELVAYLGDAMCGRLPDGRVVGYSEFDVRRLDEEALKLAHPELVKQFTRAKKQRRFFLKVSIHA
jgi:predicted phage-related endonuclease